MARILIIDGNEKFCTDLKETFAHLGHAVKCAHSLQVGLQEALREAVDVVFLQAALPDGQGIEILPRILATPANPEVIIVAEVGDPDEAEVAIRQGAWDYLERPTNAKALILLLIRVLQYRAKKLPERPADRLTDTTFEGIIGRSPQMQRCLDRLAMAAKSEAPVLIMGQSGTGKELFAWAIHHNSSRAEKNFVVVDCASLPETLVESILFGHKKGAFTGADKDREGLIKQANRGTLFLDEVGELPLDTQKSFLRVLQERSFRPVGSREEIKSDFRLITASNRDLERMVAQGVFRQDLLFRLRAFNLFLPPLREHPEDIEDLLKHHLEKISEAYGIKEKEISEDFKVALHRYAWPGNVRELFYALERAVSAAHEEPVLFSKHLPINIRIQMARATVEKNDDNRQMKEKIVAKDTPFPTLRVRREMAMYDVEKTYLKDLMSLTQGDISESCRLSGLSRSRLYFLLKKYALSSSSSSK